MYGSGVIRCPGVPPWNAASVVRLALPEPPARIFDCLSRPLSRVFGNARLCLIAAHAAVSRGGPATAAILNLLSEKYDKMASCCRIFTTTWGDRVVKVRQKR